jgi:hypothetical protein
VQIYPPTFHPGARAAAQAAVISLGSGEERLGVDLQLLPAPAVRVSGMLIGAAGPLGMTPLRLVPTGAEDVPLDTVAPASVSDGAGSFTFAAVPPGQYLLRSTGRAGPSSALGSDIFWLDLPITVSGDEINGLVAVTRPAVRITGRFEFEGNTSRPPASGQSSSQFAGPPFMLESDAGVLTAGSSAIFGEQGFTLGGYAAGNYRVRVQNSPTGWMFKSAMLNGVDVSETPFEFNRDVTDLVLTYTDRWSGIGGVVRGAGAEGAVVLAFTTNAQAWNDQGTSPRRLKPTQANARGEFGISSLPPGDYYVVALPEEQAGHWRDPRTLELLARLATQITIGEGEQKTIDLQIKDVRR